MCSFCVRTGWSVENDPTHPTGVLVKYFDRGSNLSRSNDTNNSTYSRPGLLVPGRKFRRSGQNGIVLLDEAVTPYRKSGTPRIAPVLIDSGESIVPITSDRGVL